MSRTGWGSFFPLYIDLLIENMSLIMVADNTSESDKIVACGLKTLMIKITLQFRKHNAMIATEFFFGGGEVGAALVYEPNLVKHFSFKKSTK